MLWQKHQQSSLPFYLNKFQQDIIHQVFEQNNRFPLIINAPRNHGKTSLVAILATHYLLQPNMPNKGILPCLIICQPHEKNAIKEQIASYIEYHKPNLKGFINDAYQIDKLLDDCCHDLLSFIQYYGNDDIKERFKEEYFIDKDGFKALWKESLKNKNRQNAHHHEGLLWSVIYYLIKGEQGLLGEGKTFLQSLDSTSSISKEEYQEIYDTIYKEWYEHYHQQGYWDFQDLVQYVQQENIHLPHFASLIIDDCESYSKLSLQLFIKQGIGFGQEELFLNTPMIFLGNGESNRPKKLYHWHEELNVLLYRLFNVFANKEMLHAHCMNYEPNFINEFEAIIQKQRQKLNINNPNNSHHKNAIIQKLPVYFVDKDDLTLIHALVAYQKLPLIVNKEHDILAENYLLTQSPFQSWFEVMSPSQGYFEFYATHHLPEKQPSIVLTGFFDQRLRCFSRNDLGEMSLSKRYCLDGLLNELQFVGKQALQKIFIIGDMVEFMGWQDFFCMDTEISVLKMAGLDDICPEYHQVMNELYAQKEQAVHERHLDKLYELSERFHQYALYEEYFYVLLEIGNINQDYGICFEALDSENQKIFIVNHLWKQKNKTALLAYHAYFKGEPKKDVLANLLVVQILENQEIGMPKIQAFSLICTQYLSQYQDEKWSATWKVFFEEFLKIVLNWSLEPSEWQGIGKRYHQMLSKNMALPYRHLAQCYYQAGDHRQAIWAWQMAHKNAEIDDLPTAYYEILLPTLQAWQDKLICYVHLNNLGIIMNILNTHNLNELQLDYWDKILPYIQEEQELETVILSLLPKIQSPSIFERLLAYCKESTEESFFNRLERLNAVNACFYDDWQTIIETLEHYKPVKLEDMQDKLSHAFNNRVTNVRPIKNGVSVSVSQPVPKFEKPRTEVVDMLYALNLNQHIAVPKNTEECQAYQKNQNIKAIFDAIRYLFSETVGENMYWSYEFPAMRSLGYLLEKSPNPEDAFYFYHNIGSFAKDQKSKDFATKQLLIIIRRIRQLEEWLAQENEPFLKKINEFEQDNKMLFKRVALPDDIYEIPNLKNEEDIIKSILALTDEEHRQIQRLKKKENDAIKAQKAEQERLERLEREKAEQERLEKEKLEKEKQEKERLEKEKQAKQEQLERMQKEQLEKKALEKKALEEQALEKQAKAEQERLQQAQQPLDNKHDTQPLVLSEQGALTPFGEEVGIMTATSKKMVSEFVFFEWRIFVARLYGRVNVESLATGERFSVQVGTGTVQSDWQYQSQDDGYHLLGVPLRISVVGQSVVVHHLYEGVSTTVLLSHHKKPLH